MIKAERHTLKLAARTEAVAQLRARRAAGQPVSALVRQTAQPLGISERTVWRSLRSEPETREIERLPEDWIDRYLSWGGNVAAVWRELGAEAGAGCSLRTMQRRFASGTTAAERAAARGGEDARRAHGLSLRFEAGHRNQVWQADHKQLDVLVLGPGMSRPRSPWVTWCVDDRSRAVMGWAISLQPTAAEVLAALRAAMLPTDGSAGLEGVPTRLRVDGGLEFAAAAVRDACLALGIECSPARPYSPQAKGKVERLHRTLIDTFLAGLPHFTAGPRAADGRLEASGRPLLLGELVDLFPRWVRDYNTRPHTSLDGRSPVEVFRADPTPLRPLAVEDARRLLAARRPARLHRDGIHFRRLQFTAPELADLVGEMVEIAYAPHDDRSIEVFHRGGWRCTALPQHTLTPAQRAAVLEARTVHARDLRRRQRAAARRARSRIAPITAASPTIIEITELAADQRRAGGRLRLVADAASIDLLLDQERARER